jgi:hypothetical protein
MAISKIDSKALTDSSVVDVDIADGTITSAKLAGSVANAKLQNSTVTINGTAVALGASASLEAISWQAVKTAAFNAVAGEGYFVNTTSGVITVTLPASPSIGDTIAIKDYAGTYATNNLTIARNGKNIQGVANDSLISTNRASLILVFVDDTKGWVYTVESNVGDLELATFISATGGTVATSGDYKIHSFTGDGCFVVSSLGGGSTPCAVASTVDHLVVAGAGGGGGGSNVGSAGGGGAGGYRTSGFGPAPLQAPALTITTTTYPITVGAGGTGGTWPGGGGSGVAAPSGSPSIFSTITSSGGGGGGAGDNPNTAGAAGGSGGGSGGLDFPPSTNPGGAGNTPPTSPPQGNPGGTATNPGPGVDATGSGGGGATAAGTAGILPPSGGPKAGGAGAPNLITGSDVTYSIGGASGNEGDSAPGTSGASNTGIGGRGGGFNTPGGTGYNGGAGGSGIVIIRYKFQ